MTPSEKPESSGPHKDADQASASTQTVDSTVEAETETAPVAAEADSPSGEELNGTETPPPWQRASAATGGEAPEATPVVAEVPDVDDTQTIPKQSVDQETVRTKVPSSARTQVSFTGAGTGAAGPRASTPSARRPSRGPRRASLQVKRVDPWSVLKLALVLSVALFFVWMIAVAVLYGVLDGMGVWDQLNGTFSELTQPDDAAAEPLISAARVFGVASIIGAINIVLVTALATVAAFIYNVAADFAGGVEITLSERE
ncbi:Transmembrane protein of unknown function [Saccharopolyspora kobensis]|uniref:DUF3566 domain-containing protein n=1 Tax=Saccharopolyspora kobensis TaxID=146035 RepID=A0A1H6DI68_9PSEU|nr:DUF3566 domain-containing protein [Saccharopolyspora kobensis]SEG84899.1 Transmembrane protein of unknown function [Saccharopolyspora kobensis]SFD26393.1 Transmembrane protein of unknown function [Saccharopolyspora kobensis]